MTGFIFAQPGSSYPHYLCLGQVGCKPLMSMTVEGKARPAPLKMCMMCLWEIAMGLWHWLPMKHLESNFEAEMNDN
jgi:hypothetical protein